CVHRAVRYQIRRYGPGALGKKTLHGRLHHGPTEELGGSHNAPLCESFGLQAVLNGRMAHRGQAYDGLLIGIAQKTWRESTPGAGSRRTPQLVDLLAVR